MTTIISISFKCEFCKHEWYFGTVEYENLVSVALKRIEGFPERCVKCHKRNFWKVKQKSLKEWRKEQQDEEKEEK